MENILVTGGAGFIGSHLVAALVARGHNVSVVDNFSTGHHRCERVSYHHHDIVGDEDKISRLIAKADYVFHLAAMLGVRGCYHNPSSSFMNNVIGSYNILRACKIHAVQMLDISSSSVYGRAVGPLSESGGISCGDPGNPSWQYGLHKAVSEAEARNAGMVSVRLFNVVGTRQSAEGGFVLPKFIKQTFANEPLTIYGDGSQTRSFCDVRDVVKGLLLLREHGHGGEVYNLGADQEISILELAELVASTLGRKLNTRTVPLERAIGMRYEETPHRVPDLLKICGLCGYQPDYTLRHTIRWIAREQYGWNA